MTMTTRTAAGPAAAAPPGPLGSWVETHAEPCRGERTYRVLVNHRTGQLMELSDAEARTCGQLDAGRLVTAAYQRGARHLFRPAAVGIQILLAPAGLAAVIAAITSGQHFGLRIRPAQIPVVIGLSLAAVAVHELAHALVVVRHGRAVDAAGVRVHLGTPAFYVESASATLPLPSPEMGRPAG
jgi:hypothetical protein